MDQGFSLKRYIEYALLRFLAFLINLFPIEQSTRIARWVGGLIFMFIPKRKKTALKNLAFAYGDSISRSQKKKIAGEGIRNFAVSLMEFFRIPGMLSEAKDRFEFEGTEHLDRAFAGGKGVIFVISHLGSWEYLGFLPYLRGYPCSVVVRDTRNPYIFQWIQNLRKMTSLNPIPKKGAVRPILSELRKNHLVAILIDQSDREGYFIRFFNEPAWTTSIPARLAKRTGAALIPGFCLRTAPGKYKIVIRPEVNLAEGDDWETQTTAELNRLLEKEILEHPEQWIWTHQRWKSNIKNKPHE